MNTTRLDNNLINQCISDFPTSGKWKSIQLKRLQGKGEGLIWDQTKQLKKLSGGVYAFSFPLDELQGGTYNIELDGPQNSLIRFEFTADDFLPILSDRFVLYVGRTTNLHSRLQQHLRKTKTATQVLYGMQKFYKTEFEHVKGMLLICGIFHYFSLPGDENCANRDIIENALCSKYRSPINIKSER